MKKSIYRTIPILLTAALLMVLVACSGNETPQGTSSNQSAKPEEKAAAAQPQPAEQQAQPAQPTAEMNKPEAMQPSETAEKADGAMQPAASETAEITGTVKLSDGGVMIATDQGDIGVTGQDLSAMAGKTVSIVGTLQETDGRKMIEVISVVEVK